MYAELLNGKTVFIMEDVSRQERKRRLAAVYKFARTHFKKLHTHRYYDMETDNYGLIVWME